MATVLLVANRPAGEPVVGPDVAEVLATLGISRITLLRDPSSTAVILEGWAFDPARTNEATAALFPAGGANLRTYHEVQAVGVSSAYRNRDPFVRDERRRRTACYESQDDFESSR